MKANKNGGNQFANINEIYGIIDSILTEQCFDEPMCELVCDLFTLANAGKTDGKKSLCLNLGTQTKAQQILLALKQQDDSYFNTDTAAFCRLVEMVYTSGILPYHQTVDTP